MKKSLQGIWLGSACLLLLSLGVVHSAVVYQDVSAAANETTSSKLYRSTGTAKPDVATTPAHVQIGQKGQVRRPKDSPYYELEYSIRYVVKDPSILTINEKGEWEALKAGTTIVELWNVEFPTPLFAEELRQKGFTASDTVTEERKYPEFWLVTVTDPNQMPIYRLYNPANYEHLYTPSAQERDALIRSGWGVYEGVAWRAYPSNLEGIMVHRLYNPILRDHHYTSDFNEVKVLVAHHNWQNEGPVWRDGGDKKVYRLFHPGLTSGSHHYTMDENEVKVLQSRGWKYEGVAWYGSAN